MVRSWPAGLGYNQGFAACSAVCPSGKSPSLSVAPPQGGGWSWPCPRRGRWAGYMNSPAISDWGPQYLSADGMAASLLGLWAAGVSPSRGRGGSPSGWGGRGGPGAVWAGAREARAVRGGGWWPFCGAGG